MTSFTCIHTNDVYQQYKENICNRAFKCGSELPEYVALILRNGGSQSPDRWLRELRNNHYGKYETENQVNFTVYVPKVDEHFVGSLAVIPLQLLGYYVSVAKGLDVDKPRNLAKSVTVE